MRKTLTFSLAALTLTTATLAQDGPLRRAGRALDNAGRNIRGRVESEVTRGETLAQERDLLGRVSRRIAWDKPLVGSAIQVEVRPDGTVVLRGSVASDAARRRAVDIVENTVGVTTVVDATAVAKEVKVIEAAPSARIIESKPAAGVIELSPPIPAETKVVVPPETKVIVKP